MDDNNNRRIVVLDDGETWSHTGWVCEVTDEAYEQIIDGRKPGNITEEEGLKVIDYINDAPGCPEEE